MRRLVRAIVIALLIGVAVAIGAYLTAPGRAAPTPIIVPLSGDVPPSLVHPIQPAFVAICGIGPCETR